MGYLEQLILLFHGAIWDGYIICPSERDELMKAGLVTKVGGWNIITEKGMQYLIDLGIAKVKG